MYVCILFRLSTSTLSTTMFYECWYFIRFRTLARSITAMFLYVGILFQLSHFIASMFYVCCIYLVLERPLFYVYVDILGRGVVLVR